MQASTIERFNTLYKDHMNRQEKELLRQKQKLELEKLKHDNECTFKPQTNNHLKDRSVSPNIKDVSDRNQAWIN